MGRGAFARGRGIFTRGVNMGRGRGQAGEGDKQGEGRGTGDRDIWSSLPTLHYQIFRCFSRKRLRTMTELLDTHRSAYLWSQASKTKQGPRTIGLYPLLSFHQLYDHEYARVGVRVGIQCKLTQNQTFLLDTLCTEIKERAPFSVAENHCFCTCRTWFSL